ncbi:MAG: hypothetical protein KGH61_05480 [Candidatus Micrarchaeota archaeon]|nr:hypothetical protein [Candidatus Micrarchaeota archaeon]MDE1848365.1 hypothetical protein [Candidatus Micrarchaeota archaeon]MDE1864576.1 hypothetical protein [Candidatus Micrarchaeota archaeon]
MANKTKLKNLSGHHYLMLKSMDSLTCMNALSEPFRKAVDEIVTKGWAGKASYIYQGSTFEYTDNIRKLYDSGKQVLATIIQTPKLKAKLEGEAQKLINDSKKETNYMMERLIPELLRKQGHVHSYFAEDEDPLII